MKDLVFKHFQLGFDRDEGVICFLMSIAGCVLHAVLKDTSGYRSSKMNRRGLTNEPITLGKCA